MNTYKYNIAKSYEDTFLTQQVERVWVYLFDSKKSDFHIYYAVRTVIHASVDQEEHVYKFE